MNTQMDVTTERFHTPGCTGTYSQLLSLKQSKVSTTSWILMKHTDIQKIHIKAFVKNTIMNISFGKEGEGKCIDPSTCPLHSFS